MPKSRVSASNSGNNTMAFTITGQSGATLNAGARTFQQLAITSCVLKFQSLAEDTLTWTSATTNAAGAGTIVPDLGQVVELLDGATRRFRGHVTKTRVRGNRVTVEASGPWWWMTRVMLSSNRTDANGGTSERVQFVFPTGDLRGMIINLLDRAIDVGVPINRGTAGQMAAMYDVCKVTLSNMSYAAALAKLMSRCPDAVAWFDYGTGEVNPRLKIARRSGENAMTEMDLAIGTEIEDIDIQPRLDLEVSRVVLPYMDRNPTTGKPRYQEQASGTAVTGKLQVAVVSGPEIVEQLPLEDFESYNIRTSSSITADWVSSRDPSLAAIKEQYSILGAPGTSVTTYSGSGTSRKATTRSFPPIQFRRENGASATMTGRHLVLTENVPDWVMRKYKGIRVTITGTWIAQWLDSVRGLNSTPSAGFRALEAGAVTGKGKEKSVTTGEDSKYDNEWLARPFSVQGILINTKFGNKKNVYKPWDWDFLNPPAGMAAGLRTSQNWVPWEGPITTVHGTLSGQNLLNRSVNVTGTLSECASMKALAKAITFDLMRGRRTIQLGAPARIDFGTAVGRVNVSPQDVIEEL